jgi:outer membrane lipoprotein carrier protein
VKSVIALLALAVSAVAAAPQATPTPASLAQRVQAHYDTVRSFSADFTQTYKGGFLPQATVDRGTLRVLKPGRFRWEYASGVKQLLVANGVELKFYNPEDKVGSIQTLPKGDDAPTNLLFLAGRGNLARDFEITLPQQPEGLWVLHLIPKKPDTEYKSLDLSVDRTTLELRGLVTTEVQGGVSTFVFTNLRENARLSDKDFEFAFPKGTQINR